jgi:hypothetical protein
MAVDRSGAVQLDIMGAIAPSISPGEPSPNPNPNPDLPDVGPPAPKAPEIDVPDNPDLPKPPHPDIEPEDPEPDIGIPGLPGRDIPVHPPEPLPLYAWLVIVDRLGLGSLVEAWRGGMGMGGIDDELFRSRAC